MYRVNTVVTAKVIHSSQIIKAEIKWPVALHLPQGLVKSETKNLGPYGAFICRDQLAKPGQVLTMTIEPPHHLPLKVIAEVDWTGRVLQLGMGIRFMIISNKDRQFLATTVSNQLESEGFLSKEHEED